MDFGATSFVRCAVLKDNRGRVPVGGQIDRGIRNMVTCRRAVMKLQKRRSIRESPDFQGLGTFPLKWRFPLFLHPSPLYSSEWEMHCNYHIYEPAPLQSHYTAFTLWILLLNGKRGAVRCRTGHHCGEIRGSVSLTLKSRYATSKYMIRQH